MKWCELPLYLVIAYHKYSDTLLRQTVPRRRKFYKKYTFTSTDIAKKQVPMKNFGSSWDSNQCTTLTYEFTIITRSMILTSDVWWYSQYEILNIPKLQSIIEFKIQGVPSQTSHPVYFLFHTEWKNFTKHVEGFCLEYIFDLYFSLERTTP